ncbi:MAG: hypothetical protein HKN87_20185 [Saprospiraceae bacterium]|nr:hypothetical protein [Saprospiraceae bacterium]
MRIFGFNLSCHVQPSFLLIIFAISSSVLWSQGKYYDEHIRFIAYPGFPDQHSTWNDIGISHTHKEVYVGVTNHHDKIALYAYDIIQDSMISYGFIDEQANLRSHQWQGKIHSKIIEGPNGLMYFSTDGGESREEYLMNHPHGYAGGFFMSWDPAQKKLQNLGMGLPFESIKDIDIDPATKTLYGVTYPQAHLLLYQPQENILRDLGRLASAHVPRVLFTDQWGNCYYVDWRQRLVKYETVSDSLIFADSTLPKFTGTPGSTIITGITAYAKDLEKGVIYLVTYGAKIVAFYPQQSGIGACKDLGGVFDLPQGTEWKPYVPNLNVGLNGKLYYIVGGHGNFIKQDKTLMMEFDIESGEKVVLYEFPIHEIAEATGSDVRDEFGHIYFAGRRRLPDNMSKPFLIKYKPQ